MNPKMNVRLSWRKALIVGVAACTLALPTFASAEEMMAKSYDYTGIQTMMKDGTELVPLRQIAESLGFKVTWQDDTHMIVLAKMGDMGMKEDKMMDDKGKMEDKSMMDDKGMMEDKNMMMGHTFSIQIDSTMITADGKEGMLMYTPMLIGSMTYVPKSFVEMYLLK
ncbi:stalk domain-containing protein [Paenibacillus sp. 2RAB27]|uniref:stalk domain-containing protein n=1 Tax=Paenibacillus sp. 2RAB27 TaxID=3232991 RepID=UPI003F95F10D